MFKRVFVRIVTALAMLGGACANVFAATYSVTVSSDVQGLSIPYGMVSVASGSSYPIESKPNKGYVFKEWIYYSGSANCSIENSKASTTKVTPTKGDCWVNATYTQLPTVTVTTTEGGSVTPTPAYVDNAGEKITLTANPDVGYSLKNWSVVSGNCKGSYPSDTRNYTVTVNENCTVKAVFVEGIDVEHFTYERYDRVARSTRIQDYYVKLGTSQTITAVSLENGLIFQGWDIVYDDGWNPKHEGCTLSSTTSWTTTVTATAPCRVRSVFYGKVTIDVQASAGGTVKNPGKREVLVDEPMDLVAIPDKGYEFDSWYYQYNASCAPVNSKAASTTIRTDRSCEITAKFKEKKKLTITADEGGTVSPSGTSYIENSDPITITATPDSGYIFERWSYSGSCNPSAYITNPVIVSPSTNNNCVVTAKFEREYQITIGLWRGSAVLPFARYAVDGYPLSIGYSLINAHFDHRVVTPAENCPVSFTSNGAPYVTVHGDCSVDNYYVDFFELTDEFKEYNYFVSSLGGDGDEFRYHAATAKDSWYRVDVASEGTYAGAVQFYGSRQWGDDDSPITECRSDGHNFSCVFKGTGDDGYISVKSTDSKKENIPFQVRITEVGAIDYVVEREFRGKVVSEIKSEIGVGSVIKEEADSVTGYVFKEWKVVEGDCELSDSQSPQIEVVSKSGKCSIRAVYDYDGNTNQTFWGGMLNVNGGVVNCGFLYIVDMNTEYRYNIWASPTYNFVKYIDRSDFSATFDGEPLNLYFVGDTIKYGEGLINVLPKENLIAMDSALYFCYEAPDHILNGDSHMVVFRSTFGGLDTTFSLSIVEYNAHEPDGPDTLTILAAENDSLDVLRTTEKIRFDVKTQDFSMDVWTFDPVLYEASEGLRVTVQCLNSGDKEEVTLTHVEGGFYSLSEMQKNEAVGTAVVKGDSVLSCAAEDAIVAEYVDPVYRTVVRDTVKFKDVVETEYQFLVAEDDVDAGSADLDSVEATNVDFRFRLTTVSPTLYRADTIMVLMFNDVGDSVWATAIETDAYSGEFLGRGSFEYVFNAKNLQDSVLDAAMDLAADTNRVVIRLQVGNDDSALDTRDSLVVFYEFIPADSAEIHDKDLDGRADFVRVHFARSITRESLKIDSVFWGPKGAAARAVPAEDLVVSADGRWVEAALAEPFEYGVTSVGSDGKGYLRISRETSSVSQKVALADKVGAVPVSAEKRPGRLSDEDVLNGKTELPLDTLVVTLSESVDTLGTISAGSAPTEMFFYADNLSDIRRDAARAVKSVSYSRDKSGKVWTFVLPRSVNVKTGSYVISSNRALVGDAAGNAMGAGYVKVSGEDNDLYLYALKPYPAVVGVGRVPTWYNPESRNWEDMEGASVRVETRMAYDAFVTVFDNMGNVVAQFKHSFGKNGEMEKSAYEFEEHATYESYIRWDTRTLENRLAGTGVYIWKIKFKFADGHAESRIVRSGIKRK
ncbi:MAG: hypothetical protein MJZ22_00530 [Candidatus Saccharibacteria bacterium]|nr:hypothetical protein [Candidatus Saccharibacteria bacterium]